MNKKIKTKELKEMLKESSGKLEHWFAESKKYAPSHIISDRIKAEVSRLLILQNQIRLEFTIRELRRFSLYILIILTFLFFSFLQKPKLLFELTLNNTLLLGIITIITVVSPLIIRFVYTKPDREAKRSKDLAEAKYYLSQKKLVDDQLKNKKF